MNYKDARHISRMTNKEISQYLKISERTLQRYEQSGKAPKAIIECLRMIGGQCPSFSLKQSFDNWSFGNGYLWSENGYKFTTGDILAGRLALFESRLQTRKREREIRAKKVCMSGKSNIIQFRMPTRKSGNDKKHG